jgi:hypothetical protein
MKPTIVSGLPVQCWCPAIREMAARSDRCLYAPLDSTPLIQQIPITAGHVICARRGMAVPQPIASLRVRAYNASLRQKILAFG